MTIKVRIVSRPHKPLIEHAKKSPRRKNLWERIRHTSLGRKVGCAIKSCSSIADKHLVLNCRCGHVGQIAVSDLPAQMSEADSIFVAHYLALSDLLGV